MSSDQEVVVASPVTPHPPPKDRKLWRDLTAYWIFGLCNNYGYVVMLSAAHDIIAQFQDHPADDNTVENEGDDTRKCHLVSTGAILLADILPSLFVKIVIPFLPFWVKWVLSVSVVQKIFMWNEINKSLYFITVLRYCSLCCCQHRAFCS